MAHDEKNFVSQLKVKTTKHAFHDSLKRRQDINFWNLLSPELKRRWNYPKSVSCHAGPAWPAHFVWIVEKIDTCTQKEEWLRTLFFWVKSFISKWNQEEEKKGYKMLFTHPICCKAWENSPWSIVPVLSITIMIFMSSVFDVMAIIVYVGRKCRMW